MQVCVGSARGSFRILQDPVPVGSAPVAVVAIEADGDDLPEFIVTDAGTDMSAGGVYVMSGEGGGTLESPTVIDEGFRAGDIATGHLNGDQHSDFIVIETGKDAGLRSYIGQGNSTFDQATFTIAEAFQSIALADTTGNGTDEIIALTESPVRLQVWSVDEGMPSLVTEVPALNVTEGSVAAVDIDQDGRIEIIVVPFLFEFAPNLQTTELPLMIYRSTSSGEFVVSELVQPGGAMREVQLVDLDGDSDLDIVGDGLGGFEITMLWNRTVSGCAGDADGDGQVDFDDLGVLLEDWGITVTAACPGPDLDGDTIVSYSDLEVLLDHWGSSCN